ncbi:Fe-S cluster assembly protein SufD [Methylomonas rivi]|uniref:Fe-S cluster assembly protein SufD n=1 Tax=Methylomonas rivi TaxID=2952226 RepID=A0ABT1U8P5_9GAMM|nr:Fe-S cluster assembly protein SufD [Methylomonas sp. WSC-6]MCQ8130001.1 Fe-S cluster assembly protein SufD [Methylomonas sp. WSC-6]
MAAEQSAYSYLATYPAIAAQLPGGDLPWLQAFRGEGLKAFEAHGFPNPRDEEWRYTNLAVLNKTLFAPSDNQDADEDWLDAYRLENAWSAVLVNGRFSAALSRLSGLPAEVSLQSVKVALRDNPSVLETYLGKAVGNGEHSLVAFNSAWFADGVVVEIAANQHLPKPLQILHVVTSEDALAATRNVFALQEGAEAEIVETYIGSAAGYFSAAVNECFLGDNAGLTLYKMQAEADKACHFGGTYVKQARDSRLLHHNFAFGGLLARTDIHSDLDLASECRVNGLYLGANRQHIDNHTRINHLKPRGISREFYKGVLDDRARGVFQGRVIVVEDAQQTDSEMNNRNLLLSADAEVDTKPQLEIYADDVKCSHGVTVGQLEEKSVFYLQSRGIDEASARNILTFAFANEMVDKVENAELKSLLLEQLLARFPAMSL